VSTPEQIVSSEIAAAIGARPGLRIWRNNTGTAYQPISDAGRVALQRLMRTPGMLRPVNYGLTGSTDYIGLAAAKCPACGTGPVGRFVALEVKSLKGTLSEQQRRFGVMVQSLGGIWIPARSAEEARAGIERELREG
jgi:hypothetical protein